MMPDSIIVPKVDPNYDLVVLTPMQSALAPYEMWWALGLWGLFALVLFWVIYQYLIAPYL